MNDMGEIGTDIDEGNDMTIRLSLQDWQIFVWDTYVC
jgi:hypothetical protein